MITFIRTFTQQWNLYLSENDIFKNKNVLKIMYEIYFYQKVMILQIF